MAAGDEPGNCAIYAGGGLGTKGLDGNGRRKPWRWVKTGDVYLGIL
jgi:hypothetical protein